MESPGELGLAELWKEERSGAIGAVTLCCPLFGSCSQLGYQGQ